MLQIPTCAFFRSSSVSPMPYNIACAAGCVSSCVKTFEYLFSSLIFYVVIFVTTIILCCVALCTFCNSIQQIKPPFLRQGRLWHRVTVLHSDLFVFLCVFVS